MQKAPEMPRAEVYKTRTVRTPRQPFKVQFFGQAKVPEDAIVKLTAGKATSTAHLEYLSLVTAGPQYLRLGNKVVEGILIIRPR